MGFSDIADEFISQREEETEEDPRPPDEDVDRIINQINSDDLEENRNAFSDALRRKRDEFDNLGAAQRAVLNDLQGEKGGEKSIASMMSGMLSVVFVILLLIDDSSEKADALNAAISAPPGAAKDPEDIIAKLDKIRDDTQQLNDTLKQLETPEGINRDRNRPETIKDQLAQRLGVDEVEPGTFVNDLAPGSESETTIRVVTELRDDYYKASHESLTSSGSRTRSNQFSGFTLEDSKGRTISEMVGFSEAEINEETGVVTLKSTLDGISDPVTGSVTISPEKAARIVKRRGNAVNVAENLRAGIEANASSLEDDLGFELWACLVLDIGDQFEALWYSKMRPKLVNLISRFKIKKDVISGGYGFAAIPNLGNGLFKNSNQIAGALNELKVPSDSVINFLGVRGSFADTGLLAGNSSICGHNKSKYCDINLALSDLIRDLLGDLDRLALKLANFEIGDLGLKIDGIISFLNTPFRFLERQIKKIDEEISKLSRAICGFVTKRLKGRPKQLGKVMGLILALVPSLLLLSSPTLGLSPANHGLEESQVIPKTIAKLRFWGYDAAADALSEGRMDDFLAMEEEDASLAGAAAKLLKEEANNDNNNGGRQVRLRLLAEAYEEEAVRGGMSGKVRQLMVNRNRNQGVLSLERAKILKEESEAELVDNE